MADGLGLRRSTGEKLGQMRDQVVAAALEEFRGKVWRPVGAFHFERIRKDGVRRLRAERGDQRLATSSQMLIDGGAGEVVEDIALGAEGRALNLLPVWLAMKIECSSGPAAP